MGSVALTAGQQTLLGWIFFGAHGQHLSSICCRMGVGSFARWCGCAAVLSDLLGVAEPEGSGAGSAADGDCDWVALGGGEVALCAGVAAAGF